MTTFYDAGLVVGTTPSYTATLRGADGAPIGPSGFSALTLTLRDGLTAAIVNAVENVSILNAGRGTLGANGALTITLTAADTAARSTRRVEFDRMTISWTTASGVSGAHVVEFGVHNPAGTT